TVCSSVTPAHKFLRFFAKHTPPAELKWRAFFLSSELGERALPNLTVSLVDPGSSAHLLQIGGEDPFSVRDTLVRAVTNIESKDLLFHGPMMVCVGPPEFEREVLPLLENLAAIVINVGTDNSFAL
ncbi:hypothetical protein, partial [Marinobacter sp. X15-166B]|uniref:hypothetical protein n=1 Tax=Marinobacter sp. X15-166B TaxID=1897620 RepID=UPI001A7E0C28